MMKKTIVILACCADCAAGICAAEFEETKNNYHRTNNGNGNGHQNDD